MHLNTHLRQDAILPYTQVQDMFDDLEAISGDLSHKNESHRLDMKPTDDFHTYLCMLLYRSGVFGTRFEFLKHEVGVRLTRGLKGAVAREFLDDSVTLEEFTKLCAKEASRLELEYSKNHKSGRKGENTSSLSHKLSGNMLETSNEPEPEDSG
ncbi:hypothetical protein N7471_002396 [Penicillium samsonianum]|uniref:uncharacterized protein n=1 Tax=Penicillium samsonianum TaxID=1882272 RepID=UPI0025468C11|nr:uncharacterized protein N7471_002396 [Penicillium samsonianum]KAJ6142943.1 hypothetical protein N7471_002396 [Penicillium samsonianum]